MADIKTLKFGIKDRLTIPILFPTSKTNYIDVILTEDLTQKIRISQEEMDAVSFKQTEPDKEGRVGYQWDGAKEVDKEIEITKAEADFISRQGDRLAKEEMWDRDLALIVRAIKELYKDENGIAPSLV